MRSRAWTRVANILLPTAELGASVPAELVERGAEILWQRGEDFEPRPVDFRQPQFFGVERETRDERPFRFAARRAVAALELAEEDRLRGTVERVDRQRHPRVREVHAD